MDIFTTQLTRVVPVPIKPANLKVKALLKEAANSKLTKDPNHLENHDYYFNKVEDEYHNNQDKNELDDNKQPVTAEQSDDDGSSENINDEKKPSDDKDGTKHLDLYA